MEVGRGLEGACPTPLASLPSMGEGSWAWMGVGTPFDGLGVSGLVVLWPRRRRRYRPFGPQVTEGGLRWCQSVSCP